MQYPSLNNRVPPTISYKYTKAIGGRIFNQKKVVKELDIDKGAGNMCCDCSGSKYCYEPAGHVITGDLKIVKDAELKRPDRERTIVQGTELY